MSSRVAAAVCALLALVCCMTAQGASVVTIAPAPEGVPVTTHWKVRVNGEPVPVYSAIVFRDGPAFFCSFEASGPVAIEATPAWPVRDAMVRPLSRGITPEVDGHTIRFTTKGPGQHSVEPNGLTTHPLYVFVNPREADPPSPDGANVLYFGPGLHEIDRPIQVASGQTVYLAPGAWLRAVMPADEEPTAHYGGMPRYRALFEIADAEDVTFRGYGVIDLSALDWGARVAVSTVRSRNVAISGLTFLDGPAWTVVTAQSDDVTVSNLKLIGHRESNDGINTLNSRNVVIRDCFLRVGDDGIVVKTFPNAGEARDILVHDCVLWNDKVRGIGITAETAEPISNVRFRDIDIIHDLTTGWEHAWTMSIYMSDGGPIRDIRFEDIRCEDTRAHLIQVRIEKGIWSTTDELGPIENVLFKDVQHSGAETPISEIIGADAQDAVRGVRFEGLRLGDRTIDDADAGDIRVNAFVHDLTFQP